MGISKAQMKKFETIFDRWYVDFEIAKVLGDDKTDEYRLAREILDVALFNSSLSMSQATLLHSIQKSNIK